MSGELSKIYLHLLWLASAVLVRINFNLTYIHLLKNTWINSEITHIEWFMFKHFWNHNLVILAIVAIIQLELDLDVIFRCFKTIILYS